MKVQEIRRNGGKYYHIYLPKNIIENVLNWHGRDNLNYLVVNDTLILKKDPPPANGWQSHLNCKICYIPTVLIKIIKNSLKEQYIIVARCPQDHTILKTNFPANRFHEWNSIFKSHLFTCDICNGVLLQERRKFVRSTVGFRVHLRLFCRDCGRHRVKVIAQELWDEMHIQESAAPTLPATPFLKKTLPHYCPTCEEPISSNQSFCGQCGTCLIK